MAEPDGCQTRDDRKDHIAGRIKPLPVLRKVKRLQAEGGNGGVPAANADHEKLAEPRGRKPAPFGPGEGREKADRKRAGYVDQQRTPGERRDKSVGDDSTFSSFSLQ